MIVSDIRIRNFRNYERAELRLDERMNLITGHNAQGKTNLLESLVYLSLTRSFRISEDRLMIRKGAEFARIACSVKDEQGRNTSLDAVIHSGGKNLSVNRVPVKKTSEFAGLLNTVLFSPDDLGIFLDAPRERRRLLDQEITKVSSGYLFALKNYRNLLKDRNALLKQRAPDEAYLEVLETRLIQEEVKIISERRAFLKMISFHLPVYYRTLSGEENTAGIRYQSCVPNNTDSLAAALHEMYEDSRTKDIEMHSTTCGIHREDIHFTLNGDNVINSASQGQKRMVMLGFKLAILKFIEEVSQKKAVLLLDDVLSELDIERQKTLMGMIQEPYQCVITGTEIPEFLKQGQMKEFRIEHGEVIHE
jgi:DNA replication and repair protein RecF